jgi:hypothetical protein
MLEGVYETARFITVYGTPAALGFVALYLVLTAFTVGFTAGLRSLAGVLLPIVIGSFLFVFQRTMLERLAGAATAIAFTAGTGLGLLVMAALQRFGQSVAVPLPELMFSGCFSILVFSSATGSGGRGLALYYGVMSGLLAYLVVWGVPAIR